MEDSKEYEVLVCGYTSDNMYDYKVISDNLLCKIKMLACRIINYDWNSYNAIYDISFYCRNILESTFTMLLGRSDPFRLLIVYKVQIDSTYDIGKKANCAINWLGDIISKNSQASNLWNSDKKLESFDRALLGNYMGEIAWKPAFRMLCDYVADKNIESQWLSEIVSLDENGIFSMSKSVSMRLFSSFSKGVHSECLSDITINFDEVTMKNLVKELFKLCALLSLSSHFIDFWVGKIDIERAINIFLDVEEMVSNV